LSNLDREFSKRLEIQKKAYEETEEELRSQMKDLECQLLQEKELKEWKFSAEYIHPSAGILDRLSELAPGYFYGGKSAPGDYYGRKIEKYPCYRRGFNTKRGQEEETWKIMIWTMVAVLRCQFMTGK